MGCANAGVIQLHVPCKAWLECLYKLGEINQIVQQKFFKFGGVWCKLTSQYGPAGPDILKNISKLCLLNKPDQ